MVFPLVRCCVVLHASQPATKKLPWALVYITAVIKGIWLIAVFGMARNQKTMNILLCISIWQMEQFDKTPIIPTGQKQRTATDSERQEFSSLFDEDDDDSTDDESRYCISVMSALYPH